MKAFFIRYYGVQIIISYVGNFIPLLMGLEIEFYNHYIFDAPHKKSNTIYIIMSLVFFGFPSGLLRVFFGKMILFPKLFRRTLEELSKKTGLEPVKTGHYFQE